MYSQIGSGALPVEALPSYGLCCVYQGSGRTSRAVIQLEEALRRLPTPVVGRIQQQNLYLDFRCLSAADRSEEHTSELQSRGHLVCRLLLEKKKHNKTIHIQQ